MVIVPFEGFSNIGTSAAEADFTPNRRNRARITNSLCTILIVTLWVYSVLGDMPIQCDDAVMVVYCDTFSDCAG